MAFFFSQTLSLFLPNSVLLLFLSFSLSSPLFMNSSVHAPDAFPHMCPLLIPASVEFAVKKIRLTGNKKDIDTLVREVRTLAKLGSHANVVRYYNSWIEKSSEPIMPNTALALDTSGASFAKATVQVVGSPTEESDAVHDGNDVAASSTAALGNSLELSLDSLDMSGCNMVVDPPQLHLMMVNHEPPCGNTRHCPSSTSNMIPSFCPSTAPPFVNVV